MIQKTPPGCVRAIWPRRRVMECCIRWPGLSNHLTSTQLRWFGWVGTQREGKAANKCGNSFKTVGKAFQVKLVERMQRVCKAVIKAKGGYFEESQIWKNILICIFPEGTVCHFWTTQSWCATRKFDWLLLGYYPFIYYCAAIVHPVKTAYYSKLESSELTKGKSVTESVPLTITDYNLA